MFYAKNTRVSVLIPGFNIPNLTYLIPENQIFSKYDIVSVPYRKINKFAIVLDKCQKSDLDPQKLKPINYRIAKIHKNQFEFIKKAANYYYAELSNFLKMTLPIKKSLIDKDFKSLSINYNFSLATLIPEQEKAYQEINAQFSKQPNAKILLNGITGSGKTEIYFKIIADYLLANKESQILVLLPEIILTTQLIDKFITRFNFEPLIWHSEVSQSKKDKLWHYINNGLARVIIGTRSALFLPYKNLSLIVIEEEHDQSYKQEEGVIYNARDMAILKSEIDNIPIVMTSATPSIETYNNIINGKYYNVKLITRFNYKPLPNCTIIDMRKEEISNTDSISKFLKQKIIETINKKQQILLFLNRRGYAPLTLCRKCGYRFTCYDCSAWLVVHKEKKCLECHYCGNVKSLPSKCPICLNTDSLYACGPGVERLAEEVKSFLPTAKIQLMTKDNVTNSKLSKELVNQITNSNCDIIIGTQLISKGLHFPNLSLVGIIDADIGFVGGEIKASERTFQLLSQVSGRAGRENYIGQTILQTFFPDNEVIKTIAEGNNEKFYQQELLIRQKAGLPPFKKFVAMTFSAKQEAKLKQFCYDFIKKAPISKYIEMLGPSKSYLFKLRGKYRYRILIITNKNFDIKNYLDIWLKNYKLPSWLFMKIDIDPYNLT